METAEEEAVGSVKERISLFKTFREGEMMEARGGTGHG